MLSDQLLSMAIWYSGMKCIEIGTQQLDFLDNCQCRAQVPIFDNTQIMGYYFLSIMGMYLDIVTLFRGSLQHKRGILGYRIALSTIDNDYLLWGSFIGTVSQPAHARHVF